MAIRIGIPDLNLVSTVNLNFLLQFVHLIELKTNISLSPLDISVLQLGHTKSQPLLILVFKKSFLYP